MTLVMGVADIAENENRLIGFYFYAWSITPTIEIVGYLFLTRHYKKHIFFRITSCIKYLLIFWSFDLSVLPFRCQGI